MRLRSRIIYFCALLLSLYYNPKYVFAILVERYSVNNLDLIVVYLGGYPFSVYLNIPIFAGLYVEVYNFLRSESML